MHNTLSIAQKLIQCASITPEDAGAQAYLKSVLEPLGFIIHDLPFEGNGGTYPVKNFFARYGTIGPHLCFAGHTDVVPPGDEKAWSVPPFSGEVVDGKLIGRGASDMKGQIAAFAGATAKFLHGRERFKGSISLLITGDEEKESINGTERVLQWMAGNNHIPDVCLVGEPSNPDEIGQELKIGRRGSLTGRLTIKGVQGHVAYPDRADNPLPRLVHYLDALSSYIFDKGSAFFPPSSFQITTIDVGNPASNVIPAEGRATFNIRFSDRWTTEALEQKIRFILDGIDPRYDIAFTRGAHSFLTQPGEWTGLVADSVQAITGKRPAMSTNGGTSDARFVASYCPVVEFGMVNKSIHQVDEHCTLGELEQCEMIYHEILKKYFA